jgi:hypothetical protein
MVIDSTGRCGPLLLLGSLRKRERSRRQRQGTVQEIWNGRAYQKLRAGMASGDLEVAGCAQCHALKQGMGLGLENDQAADGDTRKLPTAVISRC